MMSGNHSAIENDMAVGGTANADHRFLIKGPTLYRSFMEWME
jgi:hypothetical protein